MDRMTRDVQTLFRIGTLASVNDGVLLERFLESRDEAAFEALVRRHGPMVLGVCRRILRNDHDAEEAFQAAFVVLARRAAAVTPRNSVGHWLHGVAMRTAQKLRTASARRRVRERLAARSLDAEAPARNDGELSSLIDQELARLPARYRAAIVLCDLEEHTRTEAATRLGWAEGTVASRLARGRKLLASRLARRGVAITASGLASWLAGEASASRPLPGFTMAAAIPSRVAAQALVAGLVLGSRQALTLVAAAAIGLGTWGLAAACLVSSNHEIDLAEVSPVAPPEEKTAHAILIDLKSAATDALREVPAIEDLDTRVWLLILLARVQETAGLVADRKATLERAVAAAEESESDHRRINVAEACAGAGMASHAVDLVSRIRNGADREQAACGIAEALARSGDIAAATRIADGLGAEPWKSQAMWKIAVQRAVRGDSVGALAAAGTIRDEYSRGLALSQIAAAQQQQQKPNAGTLMQARELVEAISVDSAGNNGPAIRAELAGVLADSGLVAEAKALLSTVTMAAWGDIGRKNIVQAQCRRGDLDAALDTCETIHDTVQKGEAEASVVAATARRGDAAKARSRADSIQDDGCRLGALLEVAKLHVRAGRQDEADALFDSVLDQAPGVKDTASTGGRSRSVFYRLAMTQAEVGQAGSALRWIKAQASPQVRAWAQLGLAEGLAARLPTRAETGPTAGDPGAGRNFTGALAAVLHPKTSTPPARKPSSTFKGKLILFGTRRPGDTKRLAIEQMNPDGTGFETILTLDDDDAGINSGKESPDGTCLAFDVSSARGPLARQEIWLRTAAGERLKLGDASAVTGWSPDGKRLSVLRERNRELMNLILDVQTGRESKIDIPATDVVWDWAPTGAFLAVMAANPGRTFEHPTKGTYPLRQVDLIHPDGSGRVAVSPGPPMDSIHAAFSPDGSRIAYEERRHVDGLVRHFAVVKGIPAGKPVDLFEFNQLLSGYSDPRASGQPCWSPVGDTVVWLVPRRKTQFAARHPELVFAHVATGKVDRLDLFDLGLDWVQAIAWR